MGRCSRTILLPFSASVLKVDFLLARGDVLVCGQTVKKKKRSANRVRAGFVLVICLMSAGLFESLLMYKNGIYKIFLKAANKLDEHLHYNTNRGTKTPQKQLSSVDFSVQ